MTGSWERATAHLTAPFAVVDLGAFDANADDLVRRAGGPPIRVASKSVRCRALLRRVLDRPGFSGVMAYSVREALWLAADGFTDLFVAYPSTDRAALEAVAGNSHAAAPQVTLTIDSAEHVALLAGLERPHPLRVAIDVDASLRLGPLHLGVRRSSLRTAGQAVAEHEGRPHWGKLHTLDAPRLHQLDPRFDDFLRVRDELDPNRLFGNTYLDQVLGP